MISPLISSFLFAWPEYPDLGYFVFVCVCVCVCVCSEEEKWRDKSRQRLGEPVKSVSPRETHFSWKLEYSFLSSKSLCYFSFPSPFILPCLDLNL